MLVIETIDTIRVLDSNTSALTTMNNSKHNQDNHDLPFRFDNLAFIADNYPMSPSEPQVTSGPQEVTVHVHNDKEGVTSPIMFKQESQESTASTSNTSRSSSLEQIPQIAPKVHSTYTKSHTSLKTNSILKNGKRIKELTPETKRKMQKLLECNAGVLKQDSSTLMMGVYNIMPETKMSTEELDKRFSSIAMEMLQEREDRDLHPYGRGGRFEGVLYSRRVKVQLDHSKFLAWLIFAGFILLTSGAIIFLAEIERRQKLTAAEATTLSSMFPTSLPLP